MNLDAPYMPQEGSELNLNGYGPDYSLLDHLNAELENAGNDIPLDHFLSDLGPAIVTKAIEMDLSESTFAAMDASDVREFGGSLLNSIKLKEIQRSLRPVVAKRPTVLMDTQNKSATAYVSEELFEYKTEEVMYGVFCPEKILSLKQQEKMEDRESAAVIGAYVDCMLQLQRERFQNSLPSTKNKMHLAIVILREFPGVELQSQPGTGSLFTTTPVHSGRIQDALKYRRSKVARKAKRDDNKENKKRKSSSNVQVTMKAPNDVIDEQVFQERRRWINGRDGPTLPTIIKKYPSLINFNAAKEEFKKTFPGSQDIAGIKDRVASLCEKIKWKTGESPEGPTETLVEELTKKRGSRPEVVLFQSRSNPPSLVTNNTVHVLPMMYNGVFYVCLNGVLWDFPSKLQALVGVVIGAYVFNTRYDPKHAFMFGIMEKLVGVPQSQRLKVSGVFANGILNNISD